MTTTRTLLLALLTTLSALAAGCIPSFFPIYTDDTMVFEEGLVGTWKETDDDDTWTFAADGKKGYTLAVVDGSKTTELEAHVVRLGSVLVIDLFPKGSIEQPDLGSVHYVKAHTFMRAVLEGDSLTLAFLDGDWLGSYLEKHPGALTHVRREGALLLTAQPKELQAFVKKHAGAGLFDEGEQGKLERVRPS